jgi:hypothetical protein
MRLDANRRKGEGAPMTMYPSTMQCPVRYHGLSFAMYCVRLSGKARRHARRGHAPHSTRRPRSGSRCTPCQCPTPGSSVRTHKPMTIASVTPRLYEPSTLFDTHAHAFAAGRLISGLCSTVPATDELTDRGVDAAAARRQTRRAKGHERRPLTRRREKCPHTRARGSATR